MRLESNPEHGDYRRRNGFLAAAELLLKECLRQEDWRHRDALVWPALFSFRHYLEISLKMLVRDNQCLIQGGPGNTHKLQSLWLPVRGGFFKVFGDADKAVEEFDAVIELMSDLDARGDGFRYATDRHGNPSFTSELDLDPAKVLEFVRSAARLLNAAETAFHDYEQHIRDHSQDEIYY